MEGPLLAYRTDSSKTDRGVIRAAGDVDTSELAEEAIEEELTRFWYWRRFTVIDALLVMLFTGLVFDVWDHLLQIYFT